MHCKQQDSDPNRLKVIAARLERCAGQLEGLAAIKKPRKFQRLLSESAAQACAVALALRKGEMGVQVGKVIARTARLLHRSARLSPFPIAFSSGVQESTQGSGRQKQKR
jgi:mevalonate pyrophosphate decarboxylase